MLKDNQIIIQLNQSVGVKILRSNKSTYVSLLGLEMSQLYAKKLTAEALASLEYFGEEASYLRDFSEKLLSRRN